MTQELTEEREFLLQSIRDLDEEYAAGELDEGDYRTLRDDYTARAADVLRRLEGTPVTAEAEAPIATARTTTAPGRGRRRGRVLVGVAVLAVASAGAGYAVATSSGERGARDEVSGAIVRGTTDRISQAQELARGGRILDAVKVYDDVLEDDPENPVALAQKGWLLSRVGEPSLVDRGIANLERAIEVEPTYADSYFFLGMIQWRAKRQPAQAIETFQRGIANNPPPDVLSGLTEAKQLAEADLAAAAGATTTTPSASP